MNAQEKERNQKVINVVIDGIDIQTKKIVIERDNFRDAMIDLASKNDVYLPEHIEQQKQKIKDAFTSKMQAMYSNLEKAIDNLHSLIQERDEGLDLSNPALTNALSLIQNIGSTLTHEECTKINANFIHDQSGLRALKASYKAHNVVSPGGIDGMIYNIDDVIKNLKELAYQGTIMEGTMNEFAGKFAKFAAAEGITVEPLPDVKGFEEAARRGAGLAEFAS